MANFNKTYLMGNITRDPELRVTPKGTSICQFGLAVNRSFKGEDGSLKEEVTFVDIEAWGKQGETIAKYCTKGKPLFVEGRLKFDQWEDKTSGQKRSKLKVVLEGFQFLGDGKKAAEGGEGGETRRAPAAASNRPAPAPASETDEDVPFGVSGN